MTRQAGYDHYKRGIVNRFDGESFYGTLRGYGSLGLKVQADMEREAILKIISSLEFDCGIDVGCGPGRYLIVTSKGHGVIGLDMSPNMALTAKQRVRKTDVVLADMEHIPFRDGSFGLVYSIRVMKYLRDQAKFLREAQRVCSSNGCILLYDIWNGKNVSYLFSQTLLRFVNVLRSDDFPPEMRRMNHLLIKRMLEQSGRYKVSTKGILILPTMLYARTCSHTLLRIFTMVDKLLSQFPFSEYLAFSVLYLAIRD